MKRGLFALLTVAVAGNAFADDLGDAVRATNQFEYSYSDETAQEIVENWLDASLLFGDFRAGFLLNHQAPAEEGSRRNELRHRFVEWQSGDLEVRAGHYYALFGRGLALSAYEDRLVRVDTVLDGIKATLRHGALEATVLSGAPLEAEVDVRGADLGYALPHDLRLGASAVTYRADARFEDDGSIHREWVSTTRLEKWFSRGDVYAEYGWKKGWDADIVPDDDFQNGHAFYASANAFAGAFGLSAEVKDYERFTVVRGADGRTPLNKPPSATRQHLYTLLSRAAHALDADDERGAQIEGTWSGPAGWSALVNLSRTENEAGETLFEEAYGHVECTELGDFYARGGFGYQDSEGLRQTVVGEVTWHASEERSWTLKAEHQHVRLGGGPGFDLGAFDQQFVSVEHTLAPRWAFAAMLEINNKYDEQRNFGEKGGPFPALSVSWFGDRGDAVTVWAGKRQAGQLCNGGVCKFEPAFEGIEVSGTLRY